MAQQLGNLPQNAKIKFGTMYGKRMQFSIKSKNHAGYPTESTTMLLENIGKIMAVDGKEPSNSDSNRKTNGNNRTIFSNLRQWMNKRGPGWYAAQHSTDTPPNATNVNSGWNPYDNIDGFLSCFTEEEIAAILTTTLTVNKASVDGGGQETYSDKFFLLSAAEVGLTGETAEGTKLDAFSDNNSRLAYPTAEAVANSGYTNASLKVGSSWYWWLRTPYASSSYYVRFVNADGSLSNYSAYYGYSGFRPACNLPSTFLVSDTTDSDGCYSLIFNEPPSTPGFITVPETIAVGQAPAISWGASVDPEGTEVGYVVERRFNNGAWIGIYNGTELNCNDSAIPAGNTSVQYRVKAYDAEGGESDYKTSAARSIVTSIPPAFSGQDEDLGHYTMPKPAVYNFSITGNAPGESLIMTVKLDDVLLRTYNKNAGQADSFQFTDDEWVQVLNGTHILKIIAQNPASDVSTRTLTFTRNVNSIEFIAPLNPFYADDMPTEAIVQLIGSIPVGSTLKVLICNNGYDDDPVWEDCTFAVQNNQKFLFTNVLKTNLNWGVKVHVKLDRGSALGQVNIKSVGGNFK